MTNGNGNDVLPEHRQKRVEIGLSEYHLVAHERDELEDKLRAALLRIEEMEVQVGSLKQMSDMMSDTYRTQKLELETRVSTYQAERDLAVKNCAILQAALDDVFILLRSRMRNEPAAV